MTNATDFLIESELYDWFYFISTKHFEILTNTLYQNQLNIFFILCEFQNF